MSLTEKMHLSSEDSFWVQLVREAYAIGMMQIPEEIVAVAKFVDSLRPRHVLEIGVARGGTFYLWCKLAAPQGKKIALDLPGGRYGGEEHADPVLLASRNHKISRWAHNIFILSGDSHANTLRTRVDNILDGDQLDLLVIDGDHSYKGVALDYQMYSPFVRNGGFILFHDINESEYHRSHRVGVARLWSELLGTKTEFNTHSHWAGWGALLQDSHVGAARVR